MKTQPFQIVRRSKGRVTRDAQYTIRRQWGLLWAAFHGCRCVLYCDCDPVRLPGGIAGTGFHTLREIATALARKYQKRRRRHGHYSTAIGIREPGPRIRKQSRIQSPAFL